MWHYCPEVSLCFIATRPKHSNYAHVKGLEEVMSGANYQDCRFQVVEAGVKN